MIFVTVGTHHQPFQRLLDALGGLDASELVVQSGPGTPPPGVARAAPFMPFDEIVARMREAEKVITHAGVGSVLCATREGHVPIVVPRRHSLGEHVDEHQTELTEALAERGRVIPALDLGDLPALVASAPARGDVALAPETGLSAAVAEALRG